MKNHRSQIAAALALLATLWAGGAQASPDTFRVAFEDTLFGAVDIVVSPINGGHATYKNLPQVSDKGWLQGVYVLPGFLGLTFLQAGQGCLRSLVGAFSLLPGLALFAFEPDLSEDLNVFRQGTLMADLENPLAEKPPWLVYVLPVTPATIDARIGPISPWAVYAVPHIEHPMEYTAVSPAD